jgi:D-glycero-alpha-D-manno-heptose-7-phosphate kinase
MNRTSSPKPLMIINSTAPVRICDNGGWTDTWFARYGRIFNIAVHPAVEVQIEVIHLPKSENRIVLNAENYHQRYVLDPEKRWGPHPLLEAAVSYMHLPSDISLDINIYSSIPSGASTGTSAAVTVALLGALDMLTPGHMTLQEIVTSAHKIETELLGQQSGIQDQICAAFGGINYIDMYSYPDASVFPIKVSETAWLELERRLSLIYLGKAHHSSQIHEMVIQSLLDSGPECEKLNDLRTTASRSRDSLLAGDFMSLGSAMIENTEAQSRLHPALVCSDARKVIEIARENGALGWKVNGAGGEGGSLTILSDPDSHTKHLMLDAIEQKLPNCRHIPVHLCHQGLCVWKRDAQS